MVDSRKSLHAKQQRRRANGEFAEEQDTGLPSGDTLTDFERKRLNNAMLAAETNIIMDPDVANYSQYAASRLDELVARPAKPGETDDMPLIVANLRYDPMGADGSRADYLADHVQAAYDGVPVKARDRIQLAEETRQHILDTAVDPDKALRELGLRPVQPGEHVGGPDTPRSPGELAELRYQAALKGAQTCISSSRCFVFSHVFFSGLGSCMHFPYFSGCAEVFLPNMRASLTRRLWPVNSRSRPWCTMRSMIAAASLSSAKTVPHLLNSMFVVNMMLRLS